MYAIHNGYIEYKFHSKIQTSKSQFTIQPNINFSSFFMNVEWPIDNSAINHRSINKFCWQADTVLHLYVIYICCLCVCVCVRRKLSFKLTCVRAIIINFFFYALEFARNIFKVNSTKREFCPHFFLKKYIVVRAANWRMMWINESVF